MNDNSRETDNSTIPTQELLRRERKAAYEAAKKQRKAQRLVEKEQMRAEKKNKQKEKDKILWESLRPAKDLEKNSVDTTSPEDTVLHGEQSYEPEF